MSERTRQAGAAPRVALTTDWLTTFGGAERVLAELQTVFPRAPIHTTVHDPAGLPEECRGWDVRTSFLQRVPFARRHYRAFLPLMPLAFEGFDLGAYDVVLTTSSACAKGVLTPPEVPNVCYCYTPPRYLWDQFHEQTARVRGRAVVRAVASGMRMWDRQAADRVTQFVAISKTVAARIRRYYQRDSTVVYPPVDTRRFVPNGREPEDFLLVVARLVPYKRIDLAVAAANRLGVPLRIVGDGPEAGRLRAMAGRTVTFLGRRSDAEIADLYARCRAFVFPGMEDFGIAPVEAMAAGRPVVALGRGGAAETVRDGVSGVLYAEGTADGLVEAIEETLGRSFDPAACRREALRFDGAIFRERIRQVVQDAVDGAQAPTRREPPRVGAASSLPIAVHGHVHHGHTLPATT